MSQIQDGALLTQPARPNNRFILLDVMRAIAVFMMIQGHTMEALLGREFIQSEDFSWKLWEFCRGLTAPIFLFGSGFAYVLATVSRSRGGRLPAAIYWKRLRWILVLFLTGAIMHFPVPTLDRIRTMTAVQWSSFFQVDVLRLMAVSLLLLLAVFVFARSIRQILAATVTVGTVILLATPFIYDVDWLKIFSEPIAAYFTTQTGSFFPLFPFSAYLFAGAAGGALYLHWNSAGRSARLPLYFAIIGISFIAGGLLFDTVPIKVFPTYNYWKTSPNLFLLRAGIVLLVWSGVGVLLARWKSVPAFIPQVGRHTLVIYVGHVIILYGCAWLVGIQFFTGRTLSPLPIAGIILSLYAAAVFTAIGLDHIRINRRWIYRGLQFALPVAILILTFR